MHKKTIKTILAGTLLLSLWGCSASESEEAAQTASPAAETAVTVAQEELSETDQILNVYRSIVTDAENGEHNSDQYYLNGTTYRYALVMLHKEDTYPTLLMEKESSNSYSMSVFQYDVENEQIITTNHVYGDTYEIKGGDHYKWIVMPKNGDGILWIEDAPLYTYYYKIDMIDGEMVTEELKRVDHSESQPLEDVFYTIDWFPTSDLSAIATWNLEEALANITLSDNTENPDYLSYYQSVLDNAASYSFADGDYANGTYQYALVTLQSSDSIPTLLLKKDNEDYLSYIRIFRYNPFTSSGIEPDTVLMEGVSQVGGFRGGVSLQGDGNGLRWTQISSGTGETEIDRVTFTDETVEITVQWTGTMTDIPDNLTFTEIEWIDLSVPLITAETSSAQTVDTNRITLTGTIDSYSYDEVISIQGEPDPNGSSSQSSYQLIVFDSPLEITALNVDNELRTKTANCMYIPSISGLESYYGSTVTFTYDPYNTYWPSDTSLPLGQPSTNDIVITSN